VIDVRDLHDAVAHALSGQAESDRRRGKLEEQRQEFNDRLRHARSYETRIIDTAGEVGTIDQARDEAGRFTTGGLDQGVRGGAALPRKLSPSQTMTALIRSKLGGASAE
jgi:hypothetical protein